MGFRLETANFVIRRGDGYRGVLEDWERMDPEYPKKWWVSYG